MAMKKTFAFALLVLFFASCGDKKKIPDVSGIKVDLSWQRFDQDFFAIDSNHVLPGLNQLDQQYPLMTPLFLQNVLGVDSAGTLEGVKHFLGMSQLLKDTIARIFHNTEELKKDFRKAFQFVKYYFPDYKLPAICPPLPDRLMPWPSPTMVLPPDSCDLGSWESAFNFILGEIFRSIMIPSLSITLPPNTAAVGSARNILSAMPRN